MFLFKVVPIWIMQACDSTEIEYECLVDTSLKLSKQFSLNSNEKKELLDFGTDMLNRKIQFTAARFFNINRQNIFMLFSSTATYFIVLVQLN